MVASDMITPLAKSMLMMAGFLLSLTALAGTTERVSESSTAVQGNSKSVRPSISANGRFVAFKSFADNLVSGDTHVWWGDVFVHDRLTGRTERVSEDSMGNPGNGNSNEPSISADGRFVAFESWADNLVERDTNDEKDIFIHDRQTGRTERVSEDSTGIQGNGYSSNPSISADGRFVAFYSNADNLVERDTNSTGDIFVNDRQTGRTERVSEDSTGIQGNSHSSNPSISAGGRFVAFMSDADNLVERDTNNSPDIFVNDRLTGRTERVSEDSAGIQGNGYSWNPSISADGRFVAFSSSADNLVERDTNSTGDIFVNDRLTGRTERVSEDSTGIQGNEWSYDPSISADGLFVAFGSDASNLVERDTNNLPDIFVNDRRTGRTARVSEDSMGIQGNGYSSNPSISADGLFVAFGSDASNMVERDTNGETDIFVHDRLGVPPPPEPKPLIITPWMDLLLSHDSRVLRLVLVKL